MQLTTEIQQVYIAGQQVSVSPSIKHTLPSVITVCGINMLTGIIGHYIVQLCVCVCVAGNDAYNNSLTD